MDLVYGVWVLDSDYSHHRYILKNFESEVDVKEVDVKESEVD